jgi:serine/threonine protein kinase
MSVQRDPLWDRWAEVDGLLARLLELDRGERSAELSRVCHGDAELERTLRDLLAASDAAGRFDAGPNPELMTAALEALAPEEPLPERVGPYRIIARLGRGGMGSVFLAERDDPAFPNRVALKLLRRGVDTDDVLARFHAERQILASLHHPGIAMVFDAGTSEDGRPYLVMEHVEGTSLTLHCDAHGLDVRARLQLFMAVLRAVAHAHERGVVHRDLKPSNILVTDSEAHIKLLDFGIAKLVDPDVAVDDSPTTRPGTRLMTPGFASPEQVMGFATAEPSDIYQLGLLLYELLTGRRPFENRSAREYERAVTTGEPDPPSRSLRRRPPAVATYAGSDARTLARVLTGDLDAIVLRCLQREPGARYESVRALHDDLARYLADRPVHARRGTLLYRLRKLARRQGRVLAVPAVVVLAIMALWLLFRDMNGSAGDSARWLATGRITDETDGAVPRIAEQVTELLALNLARTDLQLLSLHDAEDDAVARQAALQAGVPELITGVVRAASSGGLVLLLRRFDTASGLLIDSVGVRGADGFELVDRGSAALLARYGVEAPALRVAGVTTADPEAWLFYIEGLTAYHRGDNRIADRLFHAALEEDSTFALAAFHAAETTDDYDRHTGFQLRNLAYRLAEHAPDRERLVIRARWAAEMEDPSLAAYADSLIARFPAEPAGYSLRGSSLHHAGRFLDAVADLEHAVALDSLSLHSTRVQCVACNALATIIVAYRMADAWDEAMAVSGRWARLQPASANAWHTLSSTLLYVDRFDASLEARGRAATLRVGHVDDPLFAGVVAIHRGDFEEADRLFGLHLRTGTAQTRVRTAHWLAISLRNQGRFEEALEVADVLLEASRPGTPDEWWDIPGRMVRAQVLFEMGRVHEAAQLFESNVRNYEEYSPSRQARGHVWQLTHAGTALAAAGDTAALAALADRVERVGARSSYGRDQRLHHYLRALLAKARGAPEHEVEQRLRAALYSLPHGYSRINLELAGCLLRQNRYEEAAVIAGAALRNSSESNGLYASRTEFHELLGRIWQAAGRTDSATVHVRAALNAWRNADPILHPRVTDLERRLGALLRQSS